MAEEKDKFVGKWVFISEQECFHYGEILDKADGISYFVRMDSWKRPSVVLFSKVQMHFQGGFQHWEFFDSKEELMDYVEWLESPPDEEDKKEKIVTFNRKV